MKPQREAAPEQKIARVSGFGSMSICLLYLTVLFLGGDSKSKGQIFFPWGAGGGKIPVPQEPGRAALE